MSWSSTEVIANVGMSFCPGLLFVAVTSTMAKSKLGEEKVYFYFHIKGCHQGKLGQELGVGAETIDT